MFYVALPRCLTQFPNVICYLYNQENNIRQIFNLVYMYTVSKLFPIQHDTILNFDGSRFDRRHTCNRDIMHLETITAMKLLGIFIISKFSWNLITQHIFHSSIFWEMLEQSDLNILSIPFALSHEFAWFHRHLWSDFTIVN